MTVLSSWYNGSGTVSADRVKSSPRTIRSPESHEKREACAGKVKYNALLPAPLPQTCEGSTGDPLLRNTGCPTPLKITPPHPIRSSAPPPVIILYCFSCTLRKNSFCPPAHRVYRVKKNHCLPDNCQEGDNKHPQKRISIDRDPGLDIE